MASRVVSAGEEPAADTGTVVSRGPVNLVQAAASAAPCLDTQRMKPEASTQTARPAGRPVTLRCGDRLRSREKETLW